jgi:hypothetical protein
VDLGKIQAHWSSLVPETYFAAQSSGALAFRAELLALVAAKPLLQAHALGVEQSLPPRWAASLSSALTAPMGWGSMAQCPKLLAVVPTQSL